MDIFQNLKELNLLTIQKQYDQSMGFSVSGSAIIIFIAVLIATGFLVPSFTGSITEISQSQSQQTDRNIDVTNTNINIISDQFDDQENEYTVTVGNIGTTQLQTDKLSILVDGEVPDNTDLTLQIDGETAEETIWNPNIELTIIINTEEEPESFKIVTENGIERSI